MRLFFILLDEQIGGPFTRSEIFEWRFSDGILVPLPIAFEEVEWDVEKKIEDQLDRIAYAEVTNEGGHLMPIRLNRLWRSGWLSIGRVAKLRQFHRLSRRAWKVTLDLLEYGIG